MARTTWTKTYPGAVATESSSSPVGKWIAVAVLIGCVGAIIYFAISIAGFRDGDGLQLEGWTEQVAPLEDGRCWWIGEGELVNTGEEQLDLRLAFMKPGGVGLRIQFQEPLPPGDMEPIRLQRPMVDCDQPVDEFKHGKLEITYLGGEASEERVRRFNVTG